MSHRWRLFNALLSLLYIIGCSGSPAPAKGGTPGTLTFADGVTSDINVTVNQAIDGGFQQTGFGTTGLEGAFVLYQMGAAGPLWLEPGDYVFTLESIGPPITFPKEDRSPQTTPLKITWNADSKSVDLTVPQKMLRPK